MFDDGLKIYACTILTHMSNLEVRVMDLEKYLFWVKVSEAKHNFYELCCPVSAFIIIFVLENKA